MLNPSRRFILLVALIVFIGSSVLLMNVTAPNPTGRRYSSEMPITTGQGTSTSIGADGGRILAKDLRLPNNNARDQRKCVYSTTNVDANQCSVCVATIQMSSSFRIACADAIVSCRAVAQGTSLNRGSPACIATTVRTLTVSDCFLRAEIGMFFHN
jgi:hypothetical protein